jgi:hypothetical protein
VARADLFGQQTAGVLGSGGNIPAVPRCDERELHAVLSCGRDCHTSVRDAVEERWRTGPVGSAFTRSAEPGTVRERRASQPGNGSIVWRGGSAASRSNMSRYFRSTTGQL